jgi:hypothetical protein
LLWGGTRLLSHSQKGQVSAGVRRAPPDCHDRGDAWLAVLYPKPSNIAHLHPQWGRANEEWTPAFFQGEPYGRLLSNSPASPLQVLGIRPGTLGPDGKPDLFRRPAPCSPFFPSHTLAPAVSTPSTCRSRTLLTRHLPQRPKCHSNPQPLRLTLALPRCMANTSSSTTTSSLRILVQLLLGLGLILLSTLPGPHPDSNPKL